MMNKFNPDYAIHVGQFLKNALDAYDMKQAELAEKIGVSKSIINEIIKGKRNINAAFALKLEPIFDMPASYWMELQYQFDIAVAFFTSLLPPVSVLFSSYPRINRMSTKTYCAEGTIRKYNMPL